MTFSGRIHDIYDRFAPDQIHPYIGSSYVAPRADTLRVLGIGINAYVSEKDWPRRSPNWFGAWFRESRDRFHKGVLRDVTAFASLITAPRSMFESIRFAGLESMFMTNAIKVFVTEAKGKRAAQLCDADYDRHLAQWHDELDAMAEHDVLPHVIAVVGDPFWSRACDSFRTSTFRAIRTKRYVWSEGACRHHVNRIILDVGGTEHAMLLVRLRHPASRRATGSPRWFAKQEDFTKMVSKPT